MCTHLRCSPDSQQGSPGDASQPQDQEGSLATLTQLASPASSCPNSRGKGRGPAQLADGESSSWEAKEQRSSKFSGISADLDFEEFLLRQRRFLEVKSGLQHRRHGTFYQQQYSQCYSPCRCHRSSAVKSSSMTCTRTLCMRVCACAYVHVCMCMLTLFSILTIS